MTTLQKVEEDLREPRLIRAVLGIYAAALVAAILLPGREPGLNFLVTAVVVGASIAFLRPSKTDPAKVFLAITATLLLGMPVYLDAGWVLAVNFPAAAVLWLQAIAGGSGWAAITRSFLMPLWALPALPHVLFKPIVHRLSRPERSRLLQILRGGLLAALLVLLFGAIFASGDLAFSRLVDRILPSIDWGLIPARILVFGFVAAGAGLLVATGARFASRHQNLRTLLPATFLPPRLLQPIEWTFALVSLAALFLGFVVIQLTVLFGGNEFVLETAGVTYAEYARSGFFQLLGAAALTLGVIATAIRFCEAAQPTLERRLKTLLGSIGTLTLVILASALKRLILYEEAFGFTRSRVVAHAVILWLAGVFLLLLIGGVIRRTNWLARGILVFSAAALLLFNLARPDSLIAASNVTRFNSEGKIDLAYLSTLSADAIPALEQLPAPLASCVLDIVSEQTPESDTIWSANYSRSRARETLSQFKSRIGGQEGERTSSISPATNAALSGMVDMSMCSPSA